MPSKDFVSITISREDAVLLQKIRTQLADHGFGALPTHLRPADRPPITAGVIVKLGLASLEREIKLQAGKGGR